MNRSLSTAGRLFLLSSLLGLPAGALRAQPTAVDSSKIFTFTTRMPQYPGGRGYLTLLADLRREFGAASTAAGCPVPTHPVNVNLLVGPSGVIYAAEFVNNLPPAKAPAGTRSVADTPPGPALPAACETALAAAIRQLPRLQPGVQNGRRQTVRITVPLVPKAKP